MIEAIEKQYRKYFPKRIANYRYFIDKLNGKSGLEIGGPSPSFTSKGFLPIYPVIKSLDGCNFSSSTVWEGSITEGNNFKYGTKTGNQIIADGISLPMFQNEQYDFILSCHSIEHFANPIKALIEWKRIIKNEGYILLVIPHKDQTFDHKRPLTKFNHLIEDYNSNIAESDSTHFEEVNKLHDLSMDPGIQDRDSLIKRTAENIQNRCVHHHVFNTPLAVQIAQYLDLKICDIQHFNPFNIIILLQKVSKKIDNSMFLDPKNPIFKNPKFPSDTIWP